MPMSQPIEQPSFVELFTPKLVTILREGYGLGDLRADALAGLTVAIVALPLSMAIAIASGAAPAQGLYAAIFGGFLVSALGGSRFQVGGPAGAFIVLVAATIARHGMEGFFLATMLAGLILIAIGFLRLGTYIKFIPYPVTVGFTAGIGIIIFASQIKDLFGLTLAGHEPGDIVPKLQALGGALGTINPIAVGLSLGTVAFILLARRSDVQMETGTPMEIILPAPLPLNPGRVMAAVQQYNQQATNAPPEIVQPPKKPAMCYDPGSPGTPDTVIPGNPGTINSQSSVKKVASRAKSPSSRNRNTSMEVRMSSARRGDSPRGGWASG